MKESPEIVVIGAGAGGYVAAIRAAQRGASVTLVERGATGGVCLNRGCIPTKTLIASAKRYKIIRQAQEWGISTGAVSFDWEAIVARKNRVVKQLVSGVEFLLRKNRVRLTRGNARLLSGNHILVETTDGTTTLEADKIILATGSEAAMIPAFHIDRRYIVTSDEALSWSSLPKTLIIVGGGVDAAVPQQGVHGAPFILTHRQVVGHRPAGDAQGLEQHQAAVQGVDFHIHGRDTFV